MGWLCQAKKVWIASCSNLAKLIQAGGKTLCSNIHRLNSIWNEGEWPQQWKEFTVEPV